MTQHHRELSLALGNKLAALLYVLPNRGQHQLRVDRTVALDQCLTESSRHELSPRVTHIHVLSLDDVGDVGGDRSVSADAVLLHLRNQLGLGQVTRGRGLRVKKDT